MLRKVFTIMITIIFLSLLAACKYDLPPDSKKKPHTYEEALNYIKTYLDRDDIILSEETETGETLYGYHYVRYTALVDDISFIVSSQERCHYDSSIGEFCKTRYNLYNNYNEEKLKSLISEDPFDHFELIHMHGYIEIELTRLFAILENKHKLNHLYQQMVKLFSHMHYPMMDVILFYAKYHLNELETKDIEMIQFYDEHDKVLHPLINELMMVLHHDHKVDYPIDKHIKKIEEVRYTGDRVELITYLSFLADRYLEQGLKKEANVLIEEVYHLYQKHHLGLSMKLYDYTSSSLLKRIDSKLEFKKSNDHMLTDKELEIITWIEKGLTNDEIAQKLFISIGTVKWHINHIYSKLEVKHRAECIKRAKDLKII